MACNVFFKFTGPDIVGGSIVKGHEGWQEVISYNHSFEQPTSPV